MKKLFTCLDCKKTKSKKGLYCKKCGYKNRKMPTNHKYTFHKKNRRWFKKGNIPWNAGLREKFKGKSIDGLHDWIERNLGKPRKCEKCKTTDHSKIFHWSNKSGKYKKDLSDYQRLCIKCHSKYDFEHFGARKKFHRKHILG